MVYSEFKNGRAELAFSVHSGRDEDLFIVDGGADRQPNLENYFLSIDTFTIMRNGAEVGTDEGMEGECHFNLNKEGTKFFFIKCDIYNRKKGSMYSLYLKNITGFKREDY